MPPMSDASRKARQVSHSEAVDYYGGCGGQVMAGTNPCIINRTCVPDQLCRHNQESEFSIDRHYIHDYLPDGKVMAVGNGGYGMRPT